MGFNVILKTIIKKIVLVGVLVSSSLANEYFFDFVLGHSLNGVSYSYTRFYEAGDGEGYSSEGNVYKTGLRVGTSVEITDDFLIEPSLGWEDIGSFYGSMMNTYSLEVPILYRYKNIKFGPLYRYNYLTDIVIRDYSNMVKVPDKFSQSLGLKAIVVTRGADFIFSYEYMLDAIYKDVNSENSTVTTTELNLQGAYFSFGIRVKF